MSNATVNRIGFEIPTSYAIRDHIMWSENYRGAISVSGTDDVRGVTPHSFTIKPRKDGRFALRHYRNGKIVSYNGSPMNPDKLFDTMKDAQWFATWHSEDIFAKSA